MLLMSALEPEAKGQEPRTETPSLEALGRQYETASRPLIKRFCLRCHSTKKREGDFDLERFATPADLRTDVEAWRKVAEMLDHREMPPKEAKQPTPEERDQLRGWLERYLRAEAFARAGDPGPVVLRRLSNAQYTYTVRDLTGLDALDPAHEFPIDGAAGEGFTNTGNALVMSPALLAKYFESAKQIAEHAVLLPDGFRFFPGATRSDWTNDLLAQLRAFYRRYSDAQGGSTVNLQGIVFDTNDGGRLPLETYLAATIDERESVAAGRKAIADVARERKLNAKYLGLLWDRLHDRAPSLLLERLRDQWRQARPGEAGGLAAKINALQKPLWQFRTVGQIGRIGGAKRWLESVDPLTTRSEFRFKIPAPAENQDVVVSLVASDAGDGAANDTVVWQEPKLIAPGRPDLLLRDVRSVTRELQARRDKILAQTERYLHAADEIEHAAGAPNLANLAAAQGLDPDALRAWLEYLGIGFGESVQVRGLLPKPVTNAGNHPFVNGWGLPDLPQLLANSSDQAVRIPGDVKPHGVVVHPTPTLRVAAGWRSPVSALFRIDAAVRHAHPGCGNGVTWSLELRRGGTRKRLAGGVSDGGRLIKVPPQENLAILEGDLISLIVGPRDGNHACDLTDLDLKLTSAGPDPRTWDLAADVSPDILGGNPHNDRFGNTSVWHFYSEPDKPVATGSEIPEGSLLAKWRAALNPNERREIAQSVRNMLAPGSPDPPAGPDAALKRQLVSLGGPLLAQSLQSALAQSNANARASATVEPTGGGAQAEWGLDPTLFGKLPGGAQGAIDPASVCVSAPSVITFRLPADLAASAELSVTGMLHTAAGSEGSVQLQVLSGAQQAPAELRPDLPVVVAQGSPAQKRFETAFEDFRSLFPPALCYTKIVPVDEVITLTLYYREDDHLARLMLDDVEKAKLDRLWDELHFVSQDALKIVDSYAQLLEYASQDGDPSLLAPLRKPINDRAEAYRNLVKAAEPAQLDALVAFAARASRRPLTEPEALELRGLYAKLRSEGLDHEQSFRMTLARILVGSAFLYRLETPPQGAGQAPVSDNELACRLSYFLWSSAPDDALRKVAASGKLHEPAALVNETRRMLRDGKIRRLAAEFACQWLQIYDFDQHDEKSPQTFPTFAKLRGSMYEESIRFFTDLFQADRRVSEILEADFTYLNQELAEHYGVPGVSGPDWRRVDGVRKHDRGGILRQATTLSKQSGASRTSPILRGNWVSEVLLGDRLPRPPKGVPPLPDEESALKDLSVRQLVEKHTSDVKCSVCHRRIDPFGFALEEFDAIGRRRDKDLGGQPIDVQTLTPDGKPISGAAGLERYLLQDRRDAFVRQFCRKLLGYALGRSVQLSDEPLLEEMQAELKANDDRVSAAIEAIVRSRQFREIRGQAYVQ